MRSLSQNEFLLLFRTVSFLDLIADGQSGVVELRPAPARRLLVWHPDAIGWMFRSDGRLRHPGSRTLGPVLGPRSVLWADGARHTAYRGVLGPALRGDALDHCAAVVCDTVHAAIDKLGRGTVVGLADWAREVALRIIGRIVLGRWDDALHRSFATWIHREVGSRSRTLAHRYLRGRASRRDRALDDRILSAARAAANTGQPALAALLQSRGPLEALEDRELRDQVVSLLFAGHETTASAVAWTLYLLHRDQRVRADVADELAATSADGADAGRVPLLHAVVQESLRLHPPAPVAGNRMTVDDEELLGAPLDGGTLLSPSIYLAHRRPWLFPNPNAFDPGRFLGHRFSGHDYFPFGGGVRHCLGRDLALLEIRMIVAAVLRRTRMRCVNAEAGVPRLRGPAMAPSPELRMVVTAWCP